MRTRITCSMGMAVMLFVVTPVLCQRQSVKVNDLQINYYVEGKGPPVLIFHGWLQEGRDWQPFLESLHSSHQVVYIDLPGHGKSGLLPDNFSIQNTAELLSKFVTKLELRGARAIGFSFGGMVMLEMLAHDPAIFRESILISTPFSFDGADQDPVLYDSLPGEFQQSLLQKHEQGEPQVKRLFNPSLDYAIHLKPEQLSAIHTPVMIVSGEEDPICPISISRELDAALPVSRLWIVKGRGHMVIDASNTSEFIRRIEGFFSDF